MELISGLLLLIDGAISLIKQRETRRQLLVKEIIEPMIQDLESVHKDYNVMLQKLAEGIAHETSEEKVRAAARTFSQDRVQYLALRQKLRVLAVSYKAAFPDDSLFQEFFKAVASVVGEPGNASLSLVLEGLLHSLLSPEGNYVSDAQDAMRITHLAEIPSSIFLAASAMTRIVHSIGEMQRPI